MILKQLDFFIIWSFSRTLHFCSSRTKCIVSLLSLDSRYCSLGMDSSCSPVSFLLTPATLQLTCSYLFLMFWLSWFGQMSSPRFSLDLICSFFISVQFSSVAQSCLTLCHPMNCSTPGLPVHHQLLEFTQTHIHRVSDAIQPSHPLSSPSPPAPNPSQHQSL